MTEAKKEVWKETLQCEDKVLFVESLILRIDIDIE